MQRDVIWTHAALRDVEQIRRYLGQFNPSAARDFADHLRQTGDSLQDFPERGRPAGRIRDLTIVWPYVIRYRVTANHVIILRVRHGARLP